MIVNNGGNRATSHHHTQQSQQQQHHHHHHHHASHGQSGGGQRPMQGGGAGNVNRQNHSQGQPQPNRPMQRPAQGHSQQQPQRVSQNGGTVPAQNRPQQQQGSQNVTTAPNRPPQRPGGGTQQAPAQPIPNILPKGWKKEERLVQRGIRAGMPELTYGPTSVNSELGKEAAGRRFKSKLELQRFLGDKYDMSLLDYRTGKLNQAALRKQRRIKSLQAQPNNYLSAAKYDSFLNAPLRQLTNPTKQNSVSVINNHKNEPTPSYILNPASLLDGTPATATILQQLTQSQIIALSKDLDRPKPTQLFWELRFSELKPCDIEYNDIPDLKFDIDLENIPKFNNLPLTNDDVVRSVAVAYYLNQNKRLTGQDKDFVKNPRIFIDPKQPLIPTIQVSEEDIKKQEARLKEVREKLKSIYIDLERMEASPCSNNDAKIEPSVVNNIDDQEDQEAVKMEDSSNELMMIDETEQLKQEAVVVSDKLAKQQLVKEEEA